jgi:hypothetical protein
VLLTIGDTALTGKLWDNPAARDLAARLPLTLTFSDFNAVEKVATLDPGLTIEGMPAGARLGTFDDSGIELLADGPGDVAVTITSDED